MKELLRRVALFHEAPEEYLDWLLAHTEEVCLTPGEVLVREGEPATHFFMLLEGEFQVTKRFDGQETFIARYDPGIYFGEVPILMGTPYIATGRALTPCRLICMTADTFWLMLAKCHCATRAILRTMAERVQNIQSVSQQHAKLMALGTLAAGMAHELNNPAAAAQRAAEQLTQSFREAQEWRKQADSLPLSTEQRALLDAMQDAVLTQAKTPPVLDTLAQSEQEDRFSEWLDARAIADSWELAPTFVTAGIPLTKMDSCAARLPAEALEVVIRWLAATLTVIELAREIDQSATRISELVHAIKTYSYMDQAPLQEIDVHEGLESTLTMLAHKLRKRGITVRREYDHDLPTICAFGSELNQVWTNILDNAADALEKRPDPEVLLQTVRENAFVLIRIIDNGPGIPPDVQPHIFEPFYTTKDVGIGTGLGLDIAYRIVTVRHKGSLSVNSRPGFTCFEARLPIQWTELAL